MPTPTRMQAKWAMSLSMRNANCSRLVRRFPWALVILASPFVRLFREMREMRYLWRTPIRMDNSRLNSVLGKEPHTPLDEAVEATLVGLGSLTPTPPACRAASSCVAGDLS